MEAYMRRRRRRLLAALAVVLGLAAVGDGVLAGATSRFQPTRAVVWGEPDVDDHRRLPARRVRPGSPQRHGHAVAIGGIRNRSVVNSVVGTDGRGPPVAHASA
jgi:hypothetical protein